MADDHRKPLDYAGRTPNVSAGASEEAQSLAEGCAAVAILIVAIPAVCLIVAATLFGCLGLLLVGSR